MSFAGQATSAPMLSGGCLGSPAVTCRSKALPADGRETSSLVNLWPQGEEQKTVFLKIMSWEDRERSC